MKAQELIKKYNEAVEEEKRKKAEEKTALIANLHKTFLQFCHVWLMDLWDEFQPGDVKLWESQSEFHFSLPISFMGVRGEVESVFDGRNWHSKKIDFGQLHMPDGSGPFVSLALYLEAGNAVAPNPYQIGEILNLVAKYVPHREKRERERLEEARENALKFNSNNIPYLQDQIEIRSEKFPDIADQIRAAGRAAIEAQEKFERERQEENQRYQDERQESTRLQELALQAWKKPFTVYKIKYGAKLDDGGEGESYCEEIYTVSDIPGDDGYYRAFHGGNLTRHVRPVHILSFERLQITDCESAPYELKRYMDLASKKFPGVTSYVALPPAEFLNADDPEKSGGD